ncbi:ABC transporter ATP-binding protein [Actinokineospora iranica]|uniref:Iron complex transport system ATP-binding protein n=1 Tax=Actinokineospora iranica TaxID=1271860 RepID=A0A1G6LCY1_9PSEU|nr:ABC transporter ATP-binding protein [Actinokineospora iranica]SDC41098.1 iron complex transport system ATP-binding protein [Actinokineospora iranica]
MPAHPPSALPISLRGISVEVAGTTLIRELSLDVGGGEVLGLLGPNGSGKSTALRCVYRAMRPTAGAVLLDGESLSEQSIRDTARRIAALTQDSRAELDFTVEEVVALGRYPHQNGSARLTGRERELCREALRRMDITHLATRSVLTLSGGERQRVLMARALVQEPAVLVLDEPTNHLDVRHQIELLGFLRRCGLTVLVALHDLNLAAATCDRIAVLRSGALVACGTPAEVLTTGLVRSVFGVDATVVTHPRTGVLQLLYDMPTADRPIETDSPTTPEGIAP